MNKSSLIGIGLAVVLIIALLSSVGQGPSEKAKDDGKLSVGFVYVGPIGDHGWTYEHNEGRLAIEKALGEKVKRPTSRKFPMALMQRG